jgi:purine-binding chemotaxis protein CheW
MNRPIRITSRPQLALQSYLDSLLQDATEELPEDVEAHRGSDRY